MGEGMFRLAFERLAITLEREIGATLPQSNPGEVKYGIGRLRLDPQNLLQLVFSLLQPVLRHARRRQIEQRADVIGSDLQNLLEVCDPLFQSALQGEAASQIAQCGKIIRNGCDRLPEERFRSRQVALL